jgi:hypothetical protein
MYFRITPYEICLNFSSTAERSSSGRVNDCPVSNLWTLPKRQRSDGVRSGEQRRSDAIFRGLSLKIVSVTLLCRALQGRDERSIFIHFKPPAFGAKPQGIQVWQRYSIWRHTFAPLETRSRHGILMNPKQTSR